MPETRTETPEGAETETPLVAPENRVPATAENFEHSLRRIVIEKAEARRRAR